MSLAETAPGAPSSSSAAAAPGNGSGRTARLAVIALFACPVIWGTTFPVTRFLVGEGAGAMPPWLLLAGRLLAGFTAISLCMALARYKPVEHFAGAREAAGRGFLHRLRAYAWPSLVLGGLTWMGFGAQTWGMTRIEGSLSALITGLFVVFTPIFSALLIRRLPGKRIFLAAAISIAGTAVLQLSSGGGRGLAAMGWGLGHWLTLLCAATYAVQIIATEYYTIRFDALWLTIGALGAACAFSAATSLAVGDVWLLTGRQALGMLYLGVTGTGICFALGTWGQRHVKASRAALIFGAEPLFGAAFSVALLDDESFAWPMLLGGSMVMLAIWLCRPVEGESTPLDEFLERQAAEAGEAAPAQAPSAEAA